jgi:molecular chaperone GrpE
MKNRRKRKNQKEIEMIKQIEQVVSEKKKIEKERDEWRDKFLRKAADFNNWRKILEKEKEEAIKYSAEKIISDLLPFLDSLNEAKVAGAENLLKQLKSILEKYGLSEIKCLNEPFNPYLHEAVGIVDGDKENIVVREIQKGYMLHEKVIRPPKVIVSRVMEDEKGENNRN